MNDLRKVNSLQLYYLWRNLAVALLCLAGTIAGTHMLPNYLAPAVSLFFCAGLYSIILNNDSSAQPGCMIVVQTMFYSLLIYTFANIIMVVLHEFKIIILPNELNFFNAPFMASLTLLPIATLATIFTIFFKNHTPACRNCHTRHGEIRDRGYYGYLTSKESNLQLKNIVVLFAILSIYVWWYYLERYIDINQNGRDWYVFVWIIILLTILDEIYFIMRYYNLYLDFQEHDEIITLEEIHDMTARTYLRFYVICGEYIYIDCNATDRVTRNSNIYDTPFITKKIVNGMPITDVIKEIRKMSGIDNGELRFFYGRHLTSNKKVSVLRYFYFLNGDISDYQKFNLPGEWIHFNTVKRIYQETPTKIATNALHDLSRLFTIILTEKEFNEDGVRKNRIRSYKSNMTLADVRNSTLNLQDDKWIKIARFNSDMKCFRLKKLIRNIMGKKNSVTYHDDL